MEQYNQALFFAISKDNFTGARKLLQNGANPNSIYQIQKSKYISTFNLFIIKCAQLAAKKGQTNTQYRQCMSIIKEMIKRGTIQCKCHNEHKCPLYLSLEIFKINNQSEILEGKCQLIRYLIIHGATLKFQQKQSKKADKSISKWKLRWFDIEGIRNYLITKNFSYKETKTGY